MKEHPETAVRRWTNGSFILDSGFYSGRGVNPGDLDSEMLEQIYQGLKSDVGKEEARNFVRFVNKLGDLSASSFIMAFGRFYYTDCKEISIEQAAGDRTQITRHVQGFMVIARALYGKPKSEEQISHESNCIKAEFIYVHLDEIPTDEQVKAMKKRPRRRS